MDTHSQRQEQGQSHGQAQGQGPRLKLDELGPQQLQHTPRYRHVSAPVQQPQNLSSFQESMRQDSVVVNTVPAVSAAGRTVDESDYDQSRLNPDVSGRISNQTTLRPQEPGQQSDRSTRHVGITIDDHQSHDGSLAQEDRIVSYEQEYLPSGSPSAILVEPLPPSATNSSHGSLSSGVFQSGYSPYYSQPPGTTLSRHLSIQLSPSTTLLPPSQSTFHPASQASYSMEGSLRDQPVLSREYVMPAPPLSSKTASNQHAAPLSTQQPSQQGHPQQSYQQAQQLPPQLQSHPWQPQSPSQQTVAVPPPPIKYIRSPLRSPKMPQLSSQAMAHAQAQAQVQSLSQARHYHSSYQHASPTIQSQQQFPPRTHRRSIQPLTLEQQQPKGGSFRYVRNPADLWPQKGSQKYRSIDAFGHSISPLRALTELLTKTYSHCNRDFKYEPSYNPRRVLTKPSKPVHNEGYDNEDYDYILYVSDILGSEERQRYLILDVLGQGTFGQVVKCQNLKTNAIVAVKVIKNKPAYFNQSMMEVTVLELLNERYDVDDRHHILRLQDTFIHRRHLCLVFELLSVNLYELIKQNQFRGLSMSLVRVFTAQLLDALCVLSEARIIHCDLKPENVLLKNLETPTIKVIDFGSACHEQQTVYTYIQSRFYRSPEVLVGLPYSSSIDIWSVGCIAAELFLGLPLFPGSSEYNQLSRIVEMLGMLPTYMLDIGKTAHEFFEVIRPDFSSQNFTRPAPKKYRLKSIEVYSKEHRVVEQPSKRYFQATTLPDIINSYPMLKKGMTPKEIEKETISRQSFINFLQGLLNLNPIERWSPHQAKLHPFITGEPFTGSFIPPTIPKKPSTVENSARLEPTLPGRASKARSASLSTSSSAPIFAASHMVNEKPAMLRQLPKPDQRSSLRNINPVASQPQPESSRNGADSTETHSQAPLSALGGAMANFNESLVDSSPMGASSVDQYPLSTSQLSTARTSSSTAMTAGSAQTGSISDLQAPTSPGVQNTATLPLSASVQHQQRPRATTMGTVGVPKNMAQLAAAMTPQQHRTPSGISGTSSLSQRIGPVDATATGTFDLSAPFTETDVTLGAVGGNGYGLRQIPERSEHNSPVLEDSAGASSGINSQDSSGDPSRQSSQRSHETPPQQQHRRLSHRFLHSSGSDGGGKAAHLLRSIAGGSGAKKSPDNTYAQRSSLEGSPSPDVHGESTNVSELTPLQRMQQQLIQSQWQQQSQQRHRYRFGYPQSGSSPSDGTSSSSGVGSNSSSRQDFLSEPEFDVEGGTLRQLNLGDSRVTGDDSPAVLGEHGMDGMDGVVNTGRIQYGRGNTGMSPHLNLDESGLPNPESPTAPSSADGSATLVSPNTMGMVVSSSQVETVLSNVEEEEEGGDEGGGDSKTRENDGDPQESSEAPTGLTLSEHNK